MIRVGSRSFFLASLLLPEEIRGAAYALYAFCRLSDDAVDLDGARADAVVALRRRLDAVYAGEPGADPVDRALADAVLTFGVPRAAMDALLEGLEWDVEGRTYDTLSEVFDYAARVAGSVGAMMAALMGARRADLVARACDLGVAMQLTNIARDVGEDARLGRLYLPRDWLREAGIDPEAWLASPVFGAEIAAVVARLLAVADGLYERADVGIAGLEPRFRPAIFAARHLYAEIGVRVRDNGFELDIVPGVRPADAQAAAGRRGVEPVVAASSGASGGRRAVGRNAVPRRRRRPHARRRGAARAWQGRERPGVDDRTVHQSGAAGSRRLIEEGALGVRR